MILVLVSCSGKKIPLKRGCKVQARDLYMASDLFAKQRAYAEQLVESWSAGGWAILSAKFGLLGPTEKIPTYNKTITAPTPIREAREWAMAVAGQIEDAFPDTGRLHLVLLAGKRYRLITDYLGPRVTYEVPMEGLGIGQQKRWLKDRLK